VERRKVRVRRKEVRMLVPTGRSRVDVVAAVYRHDSQPPTAPPNGSNLPKPLGWRSAMGSLIKKRRKRMRKKKHKKMLKATRWQRRAGR
jgi:Mitochondrial domain of unknown function (DUF1713)